MTKIKKQRINRNLTQSELSKLSGIPIRTLQNYEQGVLSFDSARIDKIVEVALVLDCNIEDLIEDKNIIEKIKKAKSEK